MWNPLKSMCGIHNLQFSRDHCWSLICLGAYKPGRVGNIIKQSLPENCLQRSSKPQVNMLRFAASTHVKHGPVVRFFRHQGWSSYSHISHPVLTNFAARTGSTTVSCFWSSLLVFFAPQLLDKVGCWSRGCGAAVGEPGTVYPWKIVQIISSYDELWFIASEVWVACCPKLMPEAGRQIHLNAPLPRPQLIDRICVTKEGLKKRLFWAAPD